ncbi:MAG: hypothetical protein KF841_14645 [Phycisphaerae bacterium]|nr:hypothetical protein [Phycisphaerae bacterium]
MLPQDGKEESPGKDHQEFGGGSSRSGLVADRHASTQAYIDYMRPRCVELARVLKKTGSFYYHCDWHASHSRTRMVA